MSRDMLEKQIGDHKYTFGCWDPDFALDMFTRFIKMAGEPMAKAIIGATKVASEAEEGLDKEMNEGDMAQIMGEAMASLSMRLNKDEVKSFFRDAQEQILVDGKQAKEVYKVHYAGRIGHLMLVTKEQMRHQFADFLELLPALRS